MEFHKADIKMNLQQAVQELDALGDEITRIGKEMIARALSPLDLLALAVLSRSFFLTSGFATLMREKNFIAAIPLLRLQLENGLRFFASSRVEEPHEYAIKVLGGTRIDKMKDRSGKPLTDLYLVERLFALYPWITSVYHKETSRCLHLSEQHFFNLLRTTEEGEQTATKIADRNEFLPESAYLEVVEVFSKTTKMVLEFISAWVNQKNKAKASRR